MGAEIHNRNGESSRQRLVHAALLALLCLVLYLPLCTSLPLMDPEEARCAVITREMTQGGDWVVPHLSGHVYYDKPAPFFWAAAAGQWLTGSAAAGGRGVAILAGIGAVLVAWSITRRMFGPTAGLLAGVALATSVEFVYIARWYRMDMPYAACMWAALWMFWRMETRSKDGASPGRRGWYGFYVFCAAATLFKGPVGLALPVMVVGLYLLLSGRPRRVFELIHWPGILLYVVIAAPWYVLICLRDHDYAWQFFIVQNFLRYEGRPQGSFWVTLPMALIYVPVLIVGILPWTAWLAGACVRYFPRRWRDRARDPRLMFLWLAAIVPFFFFTFSGTRYPHYLLPVFWPLAVMIGRLLSEWTASSATPAEARLGKRLVMATFILLPVCSLGADLALGAIDDWTVLPFVVAGLGAVASWYALREEPAAGSGLAAKVFRRGPRAALAWTVAAVVVTVLFLVLETEPEWYARMSTRDMVAKIDPATIPDATFVCWGKAEPSFEYYTGRDVEELKHVAGLARLTELFASDRTVYCLVTGVPKMDQFRESVAHARVVVADGNRRWLMTNRAATGGR